MTAPGGWSIVVGSGFKPGESVTWSAANEDEELGGFDSSSYEPLLPDQRGGFGFGLGSPDQEGVGQIVTVTVSSPSCTTKATFRVEEQNEQTAPLAATEPVPCEIEHASVDRVDDTTNRQVHLIYAYPADATSADLDTSPNLSDSLDQIETFLREHLDGRTFRMDTCDDKLDVTALQMPRTAREYAAMRRGFVQGVELDLIRKGFRYGDKLYAVLWDGSAEWTRITDLGCGGEAGYHGVALFYLRNQLGERCPRLGLQSPIGEPDLALAHEITHALGFPAECGANVGEAHVTDSPDDLMFGIGHTPISTEIDAGHDDYYNHEIPDCPDLADSAFLDPLPARPQLPVGWPAE